MVIMKKGVTIFLLVLMVSIQTPVGQLFKFPFLIEHFIKHHNQNGVSLLSFLEEHYSSSHEDADFPEDEQLPFKSITFYAMGYAVVPAIIKANAIVYLPSDKKVLFQPTYAPQQHLGSIFHPPKV